MKLIHLSIGPPTLQIKIRGKIWDFEDHRYCGPMLLKKGTEEPAKRQPMWFLRAATLWIQQGRRMAENQAVWEEPAAWG